MNVIKPIATARTKTRKVQNDVREAESDLHEANAVLKDNTVGTVVTKADVKAALEQNLQVEDQLHEAVKELEVVTKLLEVAEAGKEKGQGTEAGARSGHGAESALRHLRAGPGQPKPT